VRSGLPAPDRRSLPSDLNRVLNSNLGPATALGIFRPKILSPSPLPSCAARRGVTAHCGPRQSFDRCASENKVAVWYTEAAAGLDHTKPEDNQTVLPFPPRPLRGYPSREKFPSFYFTFLLAFRSRTPGPPPSSLCTSSEFCPAISGAT
jgi:hypothetical protein